MSEKPRAKAYVYTRVSTAMQVDGFSLDAQRDEIRRFAELKKIDIVGVTGAARDLIEERYNLQESFEAYSERIYGLKILSIVIH